MTKINAFTVFAMVLALGMAGCATAQIKEPHTMLIDKIPTNFWSTQTVLAEGHYPEQQMMVDQIGLLLKGKYQVTAKRFYEWSSDQGIYANPSILKMSFHDTMDGSNHLSLVFENATFDQPYLTVWKTRDVHP